MIHEVSVGNLKIVKTFFSRILMNLALLDVEFIADSELQIEIENKEDLGIEKAGSLYDAEEGLFSVTVSKLSVNAIRKFEIYLVMH